MKDYSKLTELSDKQLRTLRNNLNNRVNSYKEKGDNVAPLAESHRLYGYGSTACDELLIRVSKELKERR